MEAWVGGLEEEEDEGEEGIAAVWRWVRRYRISAMVLGNVRKMMIAWKASSEGF